MEAKERADPSDKKAAQFFLKRLTGIDDSCIYTSPLGIDRCTILIPLQLQTPDFQTHSQMLHRDLSRDIHSLDNPRVWDIRTAVSPQYIILASIIASLNSIPPPQPRGPLPVLSSLTRVFVRGSKLVRVTLVLAAAEFEQGTDAGYRGGDDDYAGLDVHPAVEDNCCGGGVVVWTCQHADLGSLDYGSDHGAVRRD